MKTLKESVDELNALIVALRYDEALDKFYDENIVTHENEEKPIMGLANYRAAGKTFVASISNYKAVLKNVIISEEITATEWEYSFDHSQAGPWRRTQLSVQRWKNGKIIHERHHYNK